MFKNRIILDAQFIFNKVCVVFFSILILLAFSSQLKAQSKIIEVDAFHKVVVSPYIEVVFIAGETESVNVESCTVSIDKLKVEVQNNVLNVYLEGAKIASGKKVKYKNGTKYKTSVYKGTVAKVEIRYKKLTELDLRGEQKFVFENNVKAEMLNLKIYGKSHVTMNQVDIQNLQASMFGETYLEIRTGNISSQKLTAYGESKINTLNVENEETKLTAYGDAVFRINVSDKLKVSSYGEAIINYSGSPSVQKGLVLGETRITNVNF